MDLWTFGLGALFGAVALSALRRWLADRRGRRIADSLLRQRDCERVVDPRFT